MAMGKREKSRQQSFWVATDSAGLRAPGHAFYDRLSTLLDDWGFDEFVESLCLRFYADPMGRPSLSPGRYFRSLLIGYFEGLDSERGIAWRLADSLSLRGFLDLDVEDSTPHHSTLSRTRRLMDVETHEAVFAWVLQRVAECGLLRGKSIGVDGTTLEANAAMRTIVRRDSGESYPKYLEKLGKEAGLENPTREDLIRLDRKRKKKTSNKDWKSPSDPDARIAKMKDGRTHLAHKAEHAVDLETGAIIAVTLQPADRGDTKSVDVTLEETVNVLSDVLEEPEVEDSLHPSLLQELILDKGYHSNEVLVDLREKGIRTYIAEPERGRRNWKGKKLEKAAVYANRRRNKGSRGKKLHRRRSEVVERSFAHCYETGGMRRTHLRHHENIRKRQLIHVAGHNLGLIMRKMVGFGTPRGLFSFFIDIYLYIQGPEGPWKAVRVLFTQRLENRYRPTVSCLH